MADNTVIASIEAPGGLTCVDLFRRPDGSWGFESYRRDPEDPRGWQAPGGYGALSFASAEDARRAARAAVAWLEHAAFD